MKNGRCEEMKLDCNKGSCHVYRRHVIHIYKYYKYITNHDTFLNLNVQEFYHWFFLFPILEQFEPIETRFVNFGEFVTMMSSKVLSFPARSWVFGANNMSTKSFAITRLEPSHWIPVPCCHRICKAEGPASSDIFLQQRPIGFSDANDKAEPF